MRLKDLVNKLSEQVETLKSNETGPSAHHSSGLRAPPQSPAQFHQIGDSNIIEYTSGARRTLFDEPPPTSGEYIGEYDSDFTNDEEYDLNDPFVVEDQHYKLRSKVRRVFGDKRLSHL